MCTAPWTFCIVMAIMLYVPYLIGEWGKVLRIKPDHYTKKKIYIYIITKYIIIISKLLRGYNPHTILDVYVTGHATRRVRPGHARIIIIVCGK